MHRGRVRSETYRRGVRLRLTLSAARTRLRIGVFVAVFVAANIAGMGAAFGDGEGNSGGSSVWRWMNVEDTNGTSAWGYSMSLDYGGISDVGSAVFGGVTGLCWFFYQWFVIASVWLINFALSMDWFDPLREPAANIADSLQVLLGQVGLAPMLLAITAIAVTMLVMRGAWATAIFEVVVALIVLALGTGVFADPVDKTVGGVDTEQVVASADNRGWLAQANAAGLELAGGLQNARFVRHTGNTGGFDDPEAVREDISGQLIDTFLRTPHQLINYGTTLDGTKCENEYNTSLSAGTPPPQPSYVRTKQVGLTNQSTAYFVNASDVPDEGDPGWVDWDAWMDWLSGGSEEKREQKEKSLANGGTERLYPEMRDGTEPREVVKECNEAAGERAENPSPGMAGDAATMGIGVVFLVGLAAILAFTLILLGVEFLWCALRSIWDFIIGLLPGRSRTTLWQTLATAVWCLIGVAFTSIFLVTYLLILNAIARRVGEDSIMGAFAIVDILMLIGLILFWRLRKRMRSAAARTASLLSKRPNPNPTGRPGWVGSPAKMPSGSGQLGAKVAPVAQRAKVAGQAGAHGAATAGRYGAIGVGRGAQIGGVAASGGLLGLAGVAHRVARKADPTSGKLAAFNAFRQQTEAAGDVNGGTVSGGAHARAHGSREAFADSHGLRSRSGRPERGTGRHAAEPPRTRMYAQQSSRRAALAKRLAHAQTSRPPTMQPPDSVSARDGGPRPRGKYRPIVKDGQTLLIPEEQWHRSGPPPAPKAAANTRRTTGGSAERASFINRLRNMSSAKLSAGAATAGVVSDAAQPLLPNAGQYAVGLAVGGAGALATIRAARNDG